MCKRVLAEWLEHHHIDGVDEPLGILDQYLHIINAPDDLRFCLPVFDNTRMAIKQASITGAPNSVEWLDELLGFSLSELTVLLNHLCNHSRRLSSIMPYPVVPDSDSTRHPYTGHGIIERPLYAALMQYPNYSAISFESSSAPLSEMKAAYYRLLLGYIAAYRQLSEEENYGGRTPPIDRMSACYGAQRALSRIADYGNIVGTAGTMQTDILSHAEQPLLEMCKTIAIAKRDSDCELTRALGLFFEQAFYSKESRWTGRGGSNNDLSPPAGFWFNALFELEVADTDDQLDHGPPKQSGGMHRGNRGESRGGGTFPPSEGGGDTIGLVSEEDLRRPNVTIAGQRDRIAMTNQHLPFNINELAIREFLPLLERISSSASNEIEYEVLLALEISLWTGQPIDAVAKLRVTDGVLPRQTFGYQHPPGEKPGRWFIPVSPPAYDKLVSKFSDHGCRPIVPHVVLPDVLNIGAGLTRNAKPFNQTATKLKKAASKILAELDPTRRLTLSRVQRFLRHYLSSHSQRDSASIQLLFGGEMKQQTRLHYTTRRLNDLEQIYLTGIAEIISSIYELGCDAYSPLTEQSLSATKSVLSNDSVGSRLCPEAGTISKKIEDLKKDLRATGPLRESRSAVMNYHNRFTLYTFLMMQFATGYRAVIDPLLRLTDIDPITQTAIVRDKELPNNSNARLIPVTEVIREQLFRCERHREAVLGIALELASSKEDRARVKNNFFLLDSKLDKVIELRPATFHELFSEVYPYPVNASRRLVRTALIDRDCPTESVDAFMGHWQHGQQPYGRYSTLPVLKIIEPVRNELPSLLSDLGFTVVNSALRRIL